MNNRPCSEQPLGQGSCIESDGAFMDDLTAWWASWWVRAASFALLAAAGGFLGHVMRALDGGGKVHCGRAMLEGVAAGFVGLLVMFVCEAMKMSDQWMGVIVGVSGWLGANSSIRILEHQVFKRLGLGDDGEPVAHPLEQERSDA